MRLNVRYELADKKVAIAYPAISRVDVEAALSLGHNDQEIGDRPLLAQIVDQIPSPAFKESLFVISESMQKIEHRITTGRTAGDRNIVVMRQHYAAMYRLTEHTAFECIAIDPALGVNLAE
jgi:hypothetical protein